MYMLLADDYVLGTFCNIFFRLDAVDRRGRKVKQSSSEDLRKFYDLDGKIEGYCHPVELYHQLPDGR